MKNIISIFIIIIFFTGCRGGNNRAIPYDKNIAYEVTYEYESDTLGPINGYSLIKIFIYNNHIISAIDLTSGDVMENIEKRHTIYLVKNVIYGLENSNMYKISFNNSGYPILIEPKKIYGEGGYFRIKIIKYKKLKYKDISIDPYKELYKMYIKNYNKWKSKSINSYSYIYNNHNDNYYDGIYLKIINNQIVYAKDIFSQEDIPISNKFYTIEDLFQLAKQVLKNKKRCNKIKIIYNKKYGFPAYIKCKKNNIDIFSYGVK